MLFVLAWNVNLEPASLTRTSKGHACRNISCVMSVLTLNWFEIWQPFLDEQVAFPFISEQFTRSIPLEVFTCYLTHDFWIALYMCSYWITLRTDVLGNNYVQVLDEKQETQKNFFNVKDKIQNREKQIQDVWKLTMKFVNKLYRNVRRVRNFLKRFRLGYAYLRENLHVNPGFLAKYEL